MTAHTERVLLKPGRERSVHNRHPWLFSGSIRQYPASLDDGAIVEICAHDGQWLARGYLNRRSRIPVRILTWDRAEQIHPAFWRSRLRAAIAARQQMQQAAIFGPGTDALRLVNGESDGLPGLVVDRYADFLVLQAGTLAIDQRKAELAAQLLQLTGCAGVVERSDLPLRREEGLPSAVGILAGNEPPDVLEICEDGLQFGVDLLGGQKTGFYLDQRQNRQRVAAFCAGASVLNAFAYTGGFAVSALAAGAAHVTNVDVSGDALALAAANAQRNGFDPATCTENVIGDVFSVLRDWRAADRTFDVVILDPPKFVTSRRGLDPALRGYKDINLLGLQLLNPGGILATFSCSGLVSAELFQKVVFGAAIDAGRTPLILERLHQAPDHPTALTFPEGAYLKGLLCRVP